MARTKLQNTPAIRRMPIYYHRLMDLRNAGEKFVSTTLLAECMDVEPIVVRKDIALTGASGQRRIGYRVDELIERICTFLGWDHPLRAWLVGCGALGSALLGFRYFEEYGMAMERVYDRNASRIGTVVRGYMVQDVKELEKDLRVSVPDFVILCVLPETAQSVTDLLVRNGVKAIWNFVNVTLKVPADVIVQREVIAGGFAVLSMKMKHRKQDRFPSGL